MAVLCSSARVLCAVSAVQLGVSVLGLGSLTRLMPGQFFSRRLGLSATVTVTVTVTCLGRGEQWQTGPGGMADQARGGWAGVEQPGSESTDRLSTGKTG